MHAFYAGRSDVPLRELCDALGPALGLPSFDFLEYEGGWEFAASEPPAPVTRSKRNAAKTLTEAPFWTATVDGAVSEHAELRVSVVRARRKKLLGKFAPREFEANYQVVLTAAGDLGGPLHTIERLLGTSLARYASVDHTTTVRSEVEYAARYRRWERFAGGRLLIEPVLDRWGVDFVSAVMDPESEWYVRGVMTGIQGIAQRETHLGRPVGMLRVTLLDIDIHDVDSSERAFRRMGEEALQAILASHGIDL